MTVPDDTKLAGQAARTTVPCSLAAKWLAAGFESSPLRQLAQLHAGETPARLQTDRRKSSRGDGNWNQPIELGQLPAKAQRLLHQHRATMEAIELMPEVLRSVGFDPAPANQEFAARCQKALDIVQRDLDATGYDQYQMRAQISEGWPAIVFAALPDGSYWSGGGGMARGEDSPSLLASAADSVSGVLKEIPEIEWPVLRRARRSSDLHLGRRGTRQDRQKGAVVAVHQHRASARPDRPAHGRDCQNAMTEPSRGGPYWWSGLQYQPCPDQTHRPVRDQASCQTTTERQREAESAGRGSLLGGGAPETLRSCPPFRRRSLRTSSISQLAPSSKRFSTSTAISSIAAWTG